MQGSQYFTSLNLSNLSCPCFYLLLYLTAQLRAKMDPKRLITEDKANKALTLLFTKKRVSRKESRERQEEKLHTTTSFGLHPSFPLKSISHIPLHYFFSAQFSSSRTVQTHPIRVYTIDLAKLLKHPLRSLDKRRRAFKLLHLRNRRLSWFLVRH